MGDPEVTLSQTLDPTVTLGEGQTLTLDPTVTLHPDLRVKVDLRV